MRYTFLKTFKYLNVKCDLQTKNEKTSFVNTNKNANWKKKYAYIYGWLNQPNVKDSNNNNFE